MRAVGWRRGCNPPLIDSAGGEERALWQVRGHWRGARVEMRQEKLRSRREEGERRGARRGEERKVVTSLSSLSFMRLQLASAISALSPPSAPPAPRSSVAATSIHGDNPGLCRFLAPTMGIATKSIPPKQLTPGSSRPACFFFGGHPLTRPSPEHPPYRGSGMDADNFQREGLVYFLLLHRQNLRY